MMANNNIRLWVSALVGGAALFVLALPAVAQTPEVRSLLNRLDRLERQVRELDRQTGANAGSAFGNSAAGLSATASPAYARLEVRIAALEDDLRTTTGQIERLSFEVQQLNQRLEVVLSDMEQRLGGRPSGAATATPDAATPNTAVAPLPIPTPPAPGATATPGATVAAPSTALPAGTIQEQYAHAFTLLQRARHAEAEAAFAAFIQAHPNDPLAENARYWLAETAYARGDYSQAAKAFLATYQANTTGPKAADSLLKLGMSMAALDRVDEACTTFRQIGEAVPDVSPRITKKAEDEKKRLGCP